MDRYYSVIKQTVDLAETCLEGMAHVHSKLEEGYFEQTVPLMVDILDAFCVIEKSIKPILPMLMTDQVEPLAENLRLEFDTIVLAYERMEWDKVSVIMEFKLLPGYKKWQAELDRCLLPYIIS